MYMLDFGKNIDDQMKFVWGVDFYGKEKDAVEMFEHHAKTKRMTGEDFSDCDYIALYKGDRTNREILKIRLL